MNCKNILLNLLSFSAPSSSQASMRGGKNIDLQCVDRLTTSGRSGATTSGEAAAGGDVPNMARPTMPTARLRTPEGVGASRYPLSVTRRGGITPWIGVGAGCAPSTEILWTGAAECQRRRQGAPHRRGRGLRLETVETIGRRGESGGSLGGFRHLTLLLLLLLPPSLAFISVYIFDSTAGSSQPHVSLHVPKRSNGRPRFWILTLEEYT